MTECKDVLERLGNVPSDYILRKRTATSKPILWYPKCALKVYTMLKEGDTDFTNLDITCARGHVGVEFSMNRLDPHSGLGFLILSHGFLNVARWNEKEEPMLIHNKVWKFQIDPRGAYKPEPLVNMDECGAFCGWEIGIADFERRAWESYLNSKRAERDKMKYLLTTMAGVI